MKPDPAKLKVSKELSRKEILFGIARRPETDQLFVGGSTGQVMHVDMAAEKPESQEWTAHDSYVSSIVHTANAVISAGYDGRLVRRDATTGEMTGAVTAHAKWIRSMIATPDGKQVLTVADDMACRLWNVQTLKLVREFKGHDAVTPNHFPSMLYSVACTPDGKHIATADRIGKIVIWELASGKQVTQLEAPLMYTWDPKQRIHSIGGIRSLAFSPDGARLAAGGIGQIGNIDHLGALARIEVFDWAKKERIHELPGDTYKGLVEQMQFSPDGDWLLAAGGDHSGFIKAIDLKTGKVIKQDKAPAHIHDFTVNEDFTKVYAAAHGKIVIWELGSAS